MKILEKYILRENIKPFLTSIFIVTFLMLTDRILDLLDLVIKKNLDFVTVATIFGLSLPFMLALSIPMSVLVATIMSFGRLSVDSELVAFKSCGINIYKLMKPIVIAALLLSLFMIYFNNAILPETNHQLTILMMKVGYRKPVTAIKTGVFNEFEDYTIFAKSRVDDELFGVVIYHQEKKTLPSTISAKRAEVILGDGGNSLKAILYDGQMYSQEKKEPKKYQVRNFKRFIINLADLGNKVNTSDETSRGDRELSVNMMQDRIKQETEIKKQVLEEIEVETKLLNELKEIKDQDRERLRNIKRKESKITMDKNKVKSISHNIREYQVEIHKKYALAFACLVFVLVGIPVGMMTRTSGVGMAFSVSSVVFMVYYVALIGGEQLGDRGIISPFIAMWISNIVFGVIGIFLVITTMREDRFINLGIIKDFFLKILTKLGLIG